MLCCGGLMEEKNLVQTDGKNYFAAMDLGTNSNRLLIVNEKGEPVYRDVKHVALGEKLAENHCFCSQAMERAICSFMDFSEMLKLYHVQKYRAIATAACRMSSNTKDFLQEVKKTSGIDIDVISEFEEARLTLLGAKLNAPKDKKYLLVYDLGGGSTEVTLATNSANPQILATVSVPLGARNSSEMFNLTLYNEEGALALEGKVLDYLKPFLEKIQAFDYKENSALIATSSMPLRLVSWIKHHPKYDKFASDGQTVALDEVEKVIDKMLHMSLQERSESPYIGPNRAPIFVAAGIIFRTIYRALEQKEMTASLKSAQEAIVAELAA